MGKNLKKVIFSVLLLAAVIVVSPKDAKAAGKVWMAGFNDNSITIQWTPQSLNGYRVDGYYLEKIGTQEIIWQGSADTTQVTVQATKGYSGYIRLGYRLTSLATGKKYNWSVDSVYVNTTPADVTKNNFGITAAYANIKKVAFKVNKPEMATGVQLEVYNAKNKRVLSKTSTSMGYESMNVSKDMAYKYRARYYYTNRSNNQTYYGRWSNYRYFAMPSISGKTTNKKKGIKVVLKKGRGIKQYTVSISKKSKSGFKKVKTVKVSKKKSYSFQITKNGKKKLKKGTYKWRGIYNGESLSFNMKSNEFKTLVQTGSIEFTNGSSIKCLLRVNKSIDSNGDEKITEYDILRVDEYFKNTQPVETPEGRKYRQSKEAEKMQGKLFDD